MSLEQLEYKDLSRFQILPEPLALFPNKCMICGRYGSNNPDHPLHFVNLGLYAEFLGNLYLCVEGCFQEISNQLGALTREQSAEVNETITTYKEIVHRLEVENRDLKDAVSALTRTDQSIGHITNVVSVAAPQQPEILTEPSEGTESGEEGLTEQVDVGGLTDVHDDESSGPDSADEWDI